MASVTEDEAERHPDAIAGRVLLEARLRRLTPIERAAFKKAVRLCFASGRPTASN